MKWRDTLQSTASKEMRISKKMERNERGRTTTMQMRMKDMTYSRNYRANERKFQHGPILRGKCLFFVDKKFVGYWKVVIGTQFDHLSESTRRIVHRTGSLCGPQASQEVNHWDTQTRTDSATALTSLVHLHLINFLVSVV